MAGRLPRNVKYQNSECQRAETCSPSACANARSNACQLAPRHDVFRDGHERDRGEHEHEAEREVDAQVGPRPPQMAGNDQIDP